MYINPQTEHGPSSTDEDIETDEVDFSIKHNWE
jgi:hypothetical protein